MDFISILYNTCYYEIIIVYTQYTLKKANNIKISTKILSNRFVIYLIIYSIIPYLLYRFSVTKNLIILDNLL
jgi:hypothetical protein